MWSTFTYYAALVFEAMIGVFGIRLYEEPRYDVINHASESVEIRRYGPRLAAEVELPAAGENGRDEAFRLLFAYIAGGNQTSTSGSAMIAMTTPVEVRDSELLAMTTPVQASEASGRLRMQFFLPAKYNMDNAPKPKDPRVRVVKVPGETIAALRFSGTGADFAQRKSELIGKLQGSSWQPTGEPYALGYDAPFTIPFLRRNEAAVAVMKNP
ncbi:heme-binding protein [Bradyrhizobium sp.]|uniref:SOUL family heme-binding protein n=1 Tax=Bradyrhizobium sp. TaxID=376 RepID=UPI000A42D432|nr:heme-binding protein [Bradyrhizobium sp.]